jgi:hypothetical protein
VDKDDRRLKADFLLTMDHRDRSPVDFEGEGAFYSGERIGIVLTRLRLVF